jgi:hypothetical protein
MELSDIQYIERMEGSGVATFFILLFYLFIFFFGQRRVIAMAAPNRNYELQKMNKTGIVHIT